MNKEIIQTLLNRYEENIDVLYNSEHDELFKWNALKTFQAEWFAPKEKYPDFISRFNAATADFDIFIDNSRMHPRNGVVKLYEKNPAEVERLFVDVLFAEDDGDLELRQQHMDAFIDGMEKLREEYYPANMRPRFENDEEVVEAFSEYTAIGKQIEALQRELNRI